MNSMPLLLVLLSISPALEAAGIHECIHPDGTVELRDRPCPPDAEARAGKPGAGGGSGTFNAIPADEPPATLLERADRFRHQSGSETGTVPPTAGAADDTELRCAEYEKRADAVDHRLRKGYTASEGVELRAERRRIERLLARACR